MSRTPSSPSSPDDEQRPVTGVTGPAAAILTELHDRPDGATVAALALAAGISRSTASKALTALEGRALAWRTSGGNDRTRRLPDTWHLVTTRTNAPGKTSEAGAALDATGSADLPATATPDQESQAAAPEEATPKEQEGADESSDGESGAPEAADDEVVTLPELDAPAAPPSERLDDGDGTAQRPGADEALQLPTSGDALPAGEPRPTCGHRRRQTPARAASSDGTRLGQGQLHQLALDHLRAHPEQEWTATGIAKVIGRSSGAIANALVTMVKRGQARQTAEAPKRFQATDPIPESEAAE
jgi:hypothetical protein